MFFRGSGTCPSCVFVFWASHQAGLRARIENVIGAVRQWRRADPLLVRLLLHQNQVLLLAICWSEPPFTSHALHQSGHGLTLKPQQKRHIETVRDLSLSLVLGKPNNNTPSTLQLALLLLLPPPLPLPLPLLLYHRCANLRLTAHPTLSSRPAAPTGTADRGWWITRQMAAATLGRGWRRTREYERPRTVTASLESRRRRFRRVVKVREEVVAEDGTEKMLPTNAVPLKGVLRWQRGNSGSG